MARHVPGVRTWIAMILVLTAAMLADRVAARTGHDPGDAVALDAVTLYDRYCLACHGTQGDGQGPAAPWLWPRPRDFTRGEYKWRSTPSGAPPTSADLAAAIRHGVPGTSMHAFGAILNQRQIDLLVAYLQAFAPEAFEQGAAPVPMPAPPALTPELVARGKEVYGQLGCVSCHGAAARGDGMAAANLRNAENLPAAPYDLTALPLRRPGAGPGIADIYKSLITGLSGTPMPSYMGAAPEADLWAVAAYIDSVRFQGVYTRPDPTSLDPIAIELDRDQRLTRAGYWPGKGTAAEVAIFGKTIALQGPAPDSLTPAQASLDARQCQRCHARQVREWTGSVHAGAGSPGLIAQLERMMRSQSDKGVTVESCQRCHAPLAEQQPMLRPGQRGGDDASRSYTRNPGFDPDLRAQGVNCASCHVRGWQRSGPPRNPGSGLLPLATYPLTETPIYERSDFCIGCHQLEPRIAVSGKPLLNTYREWLEGPYMPRGVQCQHCHMPNREHTWKGVHDPDTFRQGIAVEGKAMRSKTTGAVNVRARVTNVGAGHYLPTTPTPAAWLSIELVDENGVVIHGTRAEKRIGRKLGFDRQFIELEDTRIPPGESLELSAAWKKGRVAEASHARLTVRVAPDDYYEGLYRSRLKQKLDSDIRALFQDALRRAERSHYVAVKQLVPVD
jgi:mono/diheme cytochrome c family protein